MRQCVSPPSVAVGRAQVFKFCTYISIPIFMTLAIAGQPKNLEALIKNVRLMPSYGNTARGLF